MSLIKCPECGGKMSTQAKQCIHCGAPVKYCPDCGSVWVGESNICLACSSKVADETKTVSEAALELTQATFEETDDEAETQFVEGSDFEAQPEGEAAPVIDVADETVPTAQFKEEEDPVVQKRSRRIIEATLSNFEGEFITESIKKDYPKWLELIFDFSKMMIISAVLLLLALILPFFVDMPDGTATIWRVVVSNIAVVPVIIGGIIHIFKDPVAYSRLTAQIKRGQYDVNARIKKEINDDWDDREKYAYKSGNVGSLIEVNARQSNIYLRVIQYIIDVILYLSYCVPAIVTGWNLFVYLGFLTDDPIISSLVPFELPFEGGIWAALIGVVIYIIIFSIPAVIYWIIMDAIRKSIRSKWVRLNMPEDYDAYRKNVLFKKK